MVAEVRDALVAAGAGRAREMSDAELLSSILAADRKRRRAGGDPFALDPSGAQWRTFIDTFAADLQQDS